LALRPAAHVEDRTPKFLTGQYVPWRERSLFQSHVLRVCAITAAVICAMVTFDSVRDLMLWPLNSVFVTTVAPRGGDPMQTEPVWADGDEPGVLDDPLGAAVASLALALIISPIYGLGLLVVRALRRPRDSRP